MPWWQQTARGVLAGRDNWRTFAAFHNQILIKLARKKKELPLLEDVTITGIANEGKAIARVDNYVIFVPYAVPGDVVDLQVRKKKRNYAEAVIASLKHPSDKRREARCKHYGVCGGCKWQVLDYGEQLKFKQELVTDLLTRIGKLELPPVSPIIGSERTLRYRNKLEYTFSNKRWLTEDEIKSGEAYQKDGLGFHIPEAFDKVLDIDECWLQNEVSDRIRNEVKRFAKAEGMPFYDIRNREGFLRNLIVRTANTGELMVILVVRNVENQYDKQLATIMDFIAGTFPEITSLMYIVNNKSNDTYTDLPASVWRGKDHIIETMEGLRFKVGPKSFYQTNSEQAHALYQVARQAAGLTGDELVYDLYTGTGTIANFVAAKAREVIGIEYVPDAIEDAKVNSQLNGIGNTRFFAGDMKDILTDAFISEHGRPDVIITDPPRAGMHPSVIDTILNAKPRTIVYVSCNPATQARDLETLCGDGYAVTAVQPVDMFPHTHHVENVVTLKIK